MPPQGPPPSPHRPQPGARSSPLSPPAPPPPPRGGVRPAQAVALGLAIVLLIGAVVAAVVSSGGSGASRGAKKEVFREPISSTRNPFSPPTGDDYPRMPAVQTQGVSTQVGAQPGLYGGTMQRASCDKQQLVVYLQANPDKAYAWASTIGIQVSEISTYVNSLTAVLLRSDTRVTNHGYVNGHTTSFQAVLEAGTAVLVDDKGEPVAKCYCGNPLTPPIAYPPVYYGPRWGGFDPSSLTVIIKNTTTINVFTLVDPATGQSFTRPAGTDGTKDTPANAAPTTTTSGATPSTGSTTTVTGSAATGDRPILAKLEREAKACYPFPGIQQDVTEQRSTSPGPDAGTLVLRVVGTTATGGTQIFTWQVDRRTLAFTPIDELARLASSHCPALGAPG